MIPTSERLAARARLASDNGDQQTALWLGKASARVFADENGLDPNWLDDVFVDPPESVSPFDEDSGRRPER